MKSIKKKKKKKHDLPLILWIKGNSFTFFNYKQDKKTI